MINSSPSLGGGCAQNRPVEPAMRVAYTGCQTEVDAVARALREAGVDPIIEHPADQVGAGEVMVTVGATAVGEALAQILVAIFKGAVDRVRRHGDEAGTAAPPGEDSGAPRWVGDVDLIPQVSALDETISVDPEMQVSVTVSVEIACQACGKGQMLEVDQRDLPKSYDVTCRGCRRLLDVYVPPHKGWVLAPLKETETD